MERPLYFAAAFCRRPATAHTHHRPRHLSCLHCMPILSLQHVDVSRGGAPVLHDINLTLHAGEHLAILGPNGCGKSTLLKTITGELYPLIKPQTSISIFGRRRWDLTELRQRLGVVSSDLPGRPFLHTSGFDAILTGFFSASTLWPNLHVTSAMRARAEDLLQQVGAQDLRHKPVGEMSAGQQRRILIARALAGSRAAAQLHHRTGAASHPAILPTDPAITPTEAAITPTEAAGEMLLLDEPSNALDIAAQRDLRDLLRQLARQGTAILLITHHTADIIPEIDRVILLRDGSIAADGPKRDLLTAPTLSRLFNTPITVTERDGYFHTS